MSANLRHEPFMSPAPLPCEGALDRVDPDGVIEGWCWCPSDPAAVIDVELRLDGRPVAWATCDMMRPDLAAAGIGGGSHGFLVVLPLELCRGAGVVTLHAGDPARQIGVAVPVAWGSAPAMLPPLEGNLDGVTSDGLISGWCWHPTAPQVQATLDVLLDGTLVGQAQARDHRPDLQKAGIGDGMHGFRFALPWQALDGRGCVVVELRDAATGTSFGDRQTLRLGPLSPIEDRIAAMERDLRHIHAEIAHLTREQERRVVEAPSQDMFTVIGALLTEMGTSADPATAFAQGAPALSLRHAMARMQARHAPITLAVAVDPIATIAIPASADLGTLHACLDALHAAGIDRRAAIVLLDDGTGAPELTLLPSLVRNLHVLPIPGLGEAFATLPSGRPIAWLSPLLRPEPGWLDTLLATLDREPDAALVSGRVVGRDGLLRHAGLLADAHGQLASPGVLDDATRPELSYLREVDAVGALGFVLRSSLVADVAPGLPPALAVLALCRSLRAAGHRLFVQPHATAWCTDDADLAGLIPEGEAAENPNTVVGRALIVDTALPRPDHDAGSRATVEQLLVLRRLGWHVTFAAAAGIAPDAAEAADLEARGVELVRLPGADSATAWLLQHGAALDLVQLWRHTNASQFLDRVRTLAPRAKLIFAPADLHHLRESRRAALAPGARHATEALRDQELACAHAADATLVHSDAEFDLLRPELGVERLRLMRWIARPTPAPAGWADRAGLCFIGGFAHGPNEDGLRWFLAEVLPHLRVARPGLVLHIVGADLPEDLAASAGPDIAVHGWVADLDGFCAAMRLSVAPLRYGAGFKGKVATSLSFGVPVIATTIAAEGTGLVDGDGIVIADDSKDFAHAIIRLHDDEAAWTAQSARALERCRALYAPEAAVGVYQALLKSWDLPRPRTCPQARDVA